MVVVVVGVVVNHESSGRVRVFINLGESYSGEVPVQQFFSS